MPILYVAQRGRVERLPLGSLTCMQRCFREVALVMVEDSKSPGISVEVKSRSCPWRFFWPAWSTVTFLLDTQTLTHLHTFWVHHREFDVWEANHTPNCHGIITPFLLKLQSDGIEKEKTFLKALQILNNSWARKKKKQRPSLPKYIWLRVRSLVPLWPRGRFNNRHRKAWESWRGFRCQSWR